MSSGSSRPLPGPLGEFAAGFAVELSQLGYTPGTVRHQLRLLRQLSIWLDEQELGLTALGQEGVVERFVAGRRALGCKMHRSARSVRPLLCHLQSLGAIEEVSGPLSPVEALLERYRAYLLTQRGLAASTTRAYVRAVRPFVASRLIDDRLDIERLTAADVTGFVLTVCGDRPLPSHKMTMTALRSLLGFFHAEGLVACSLVGAVPSVAHWRLAGLPKGLEPDEVGRLLAACNRSTGSGLRSLAIVLLMVRLGLRCGEVTAMQLDDIDWRAGELVVRGKGDRHERLPLPDDVGRAIVDYLQHGRPATAQGRCVFVRHKAPHHGLSRTGITQVVFTLGEAAGLGTVRAHRLRHTAATQLLATGAPLSEIGQLLRHRRAATTAIYAKVDRGALSALAWPWPGGVR